MLIYLIQVRIGCTSKWDFATLLWPELLISLSTQEPMEWVIIIIIVVIESAVKIITVLIIILYFPHCRNLLNPGHQPPHIRLLIAEC